jgi:mono/diheme cytochrome c family protein
MRKPLLLLPAVLLFGYAAFLAAPAQAGQTPSKSGGEITAHVKTVYKADCGICHGDNGDGKTDLAKDMALTMSDFTDPRSLQNRTDQDLFQLIRKGKDKMPPEEEGRAKDAEVHSLILFIRSMSKGQPIPAAAPAATPAETPAPTPAPTTAPSSR